MAKLLRPSIMRSSEWYKRENRDAEEWNRIRQQVLKLDNWSSLEQKILEQFLTSGGHVCDKNESVAWVNKMLASIPVGELRGYLPEGLAVVFHEEGPWKQSPEAVHKWGLGA